MPQQHANGLQGCKELIIINDSLLNVPTEPTEESVSNHQEGPALNETADM